MLQQIMNGKPRQAQVQKLFDRFKAMRDGEHIGHNEISALIGEPVKSHAYMGVVQGAKRLCLKQIGVSIQSVRGVGYERQTGKAQIDTGMRDATRATKGLNRAAHKVIAIADDRLDDEGRKRRDFAAARYSQLVEYVRAEQRAIAAKPKTPELLPR